MFKPDERIFENQLFDKLVRLQVDLTKYLEGAISNTYIQSTNYQGQITKGLSIYYVLREVCGQNAKCQCPFSALNKVKSHHYIFSCFFDMDLKLHGVFRPVLLFTWST